MGSAAAWWLARRGRPVVLVDQFGAGHVRGGSHGAQLRLDEGRAAVVPRSDEGVTVTTRLRQYRSRLAVLACGPWTPQTLRAATPSGAASLPPITVTREQVFHFPRRPGDATDWP